MFSITAWFSVASEGREHTRYIFEVNMRCLNVNFDTTVIELGT